MTGVYDLFLSRVAEGRKMAVERVAESAEGRIFGGRDALTRGLVDEIGGLEEAIQRARSLAHLPADARVAGAEESRGLVQSFVDDEPESDARRSPVSAEVVERLSPEVVPFLASLGGLSRGDSALCALPFALTIR
jgi:protease-4